MDEPLPGNYDSPGEEWTGGATDGSPLFPDPPDMWSYSPEQVLATRRAQYPGTPVEYAGIEPARQVGIGGGLGRSNMGDGALARADARVADELNARFRPAVPVTLEEARRLRVRNQYQLDSTTEKVRGSLWGDAFATLLRYRVDGVGHHSGPPAPVQDALDSVPGPRMFTPGAEHLQVPERPRVYDLTVDDVANALGLSAKTVGRKLKKGDLPPVPHHEVVPGRGGLSRQRFDFIWVESAREWLRI